MAEPYQTYIQLMSWVNLDVTGMLPLNCLKVREAETWLARALTPLQPNYPTP